MGMERHGMTPIEQIVMDLHDRGRTARQIAAESGYQLDHVQKIISRLTVGPADLWQRDAARGSAQLLAAIRRYQARRAA